MPTTRFAHDARIFQSRCWPPIPVVRIVIQKQDRAHWWRERNDGGLPCTVRCADNQVLNRLLFGWSSRIGHRPNLGHRLICQPRGWIEWCDVILGHSEFSIIPDAPVRFATESPRIFPVWGSL